MSQCCFQSHQILFSTGLDTLQVMSKRINSQPIIWLNTALSDVKEQAMLRQTDPNQHSQ